MFQYFSFLFHFTTGSEERLQDSSDSLFDKIVNELEQIHLNQGLQMNCWDFLS
jgi:hypothetical protein